MLGVSRAVTKRVLALDSFGHEEAKTFRGRHRRSLRDAWEHSLVSRLRCPASDGNELTLPAPSPGPAAPAGRAERGALRSCGEAACPGSGPVASASSLGPRPAPPPPEAMPLDLS
ncbi:unnamed protein product [Coccothraustes coccothraustes]